MEKEIERMAHAMSKWDDELIDFMESHSHYVWQFKACQKARLLKKERRQNEM